MDQAIPSQPKSSKWKSDYLCLLPLFIFTLCCIWKSIDFKFHDFGNYYYGAQVMLDGKFDEQIYNADHCNSFIKEEYNPAYFGAFYPNPPSLAMLYSPICKYTPRKAKFLLNIGAIIFFLIAINRLNSKWKLSPLAVLLLPLVFSFPIYKCILFGQPYLLVVSLIIFGYLQLESDKVSVGHLAWPLAILLKVSPVVLLSIPLLERRYKDLLIIAGVLITGGLLSLIWIDLSTWIYYVTEVLSRVSDGILYDAYAIGAESLPVLLRHLFLYDPMLNPLPLIASTPVFSIAFALCKGLLYTIGITVSGNTQVPTGLKVSLWLMILLLLSPNISSYGLIYLIIPYLYLSHYKARIDIPASVLLFCIGMYKQSWFADWPLIFQFGKLIGVGLFLIYFIYRTGLIERLFDKWTIAIFSVLSMLLILLGGKRDSESIGNYALPPTPKALLHQYDITQDRKVKMINHVAEGYDTVYHSLSINAFQKIRTMNANEVDGLDHKFIESVAIDKPIILAAGNIYYMTDEKRAPGFYTIKKVKLSKVSND